MPTADRRTTIRGSAGIFYDQNHFNYNDTYINQTLLTENASRSGTTTRPRTRSGTPPIRPAAPQAARVPGRSTSRSSRLSVARHGGADGDGDGARLPRPVHGQGRRAGHAPVRRTGSRSRPTTCYSQGYDVIVQRNINLAQVNGQFVTIDPRFTAINTYQNLAWIRYNAPAVTARVRGNRLRGGISYTLAKATSNSLASGVGGGAVTNPLDMSIDIGPTNEDRRPRRRRRLLVLFPFDFQLAGIARYQSALPYSVSSSAIVFARPEPRNSRRGDNEKVMDLRVGKNLRLGGRRSRDGVLGDVQRLQHEKLPAVPGQPAVDRVRAAAGRCAMRRQQFGLPLRFLIVT